MDLETGFITWAGLGAQQDFDIQDIGLSCTGLKAVAMDMNTSFNISSEILSEGPHRYDQYHMQAQFGRDVIGPCAWRKHKKH